MVQNFREYWTTRAGLAIHACICEHVMITIKFTPETKDSIIREQKANGMFLIELQMHSKEAKVEPGNNLVFDTKPKQERISELQALKNRIVILEAKVLKT